MLFGCWYQYIATADQDQGEILSLQPDMALHVTTSRISRSVEHESHKTYPSLHH